MSRLDVPASGCSAVGGAVYLPTLAEPVPLRLSESPGYKFSANKLTCKLGASKRQPPVILVAAGSFNPPTIMHLRMFELAKDKLQQLGYEVWGAFMSPVGDSYGKQGLAAAHHRVAMCELAVATSDIIAVDAWEAQQPQYTRTLTVLQHVKHEVDTHLLSLSKPTQQPHHADVLCSSATVTCQQAGMGSFANSSDKQVQELLAPSAPQPDQLKPVQASSLGARVMLLCGADVLLSFLKPGVWKDPDKLLAEHGVVCVTREGSDLDTRLNQPGSILYEYRQNIVTVTERIPNEISSSRVRNELSAGNSVKYLLLDGVIAYITHHKLYGT